PLRRDHMRLNQRRKASCAPGRDLISRSRPVLAQVVRLVDARANPEAKQERLHVYGESPRDRLQEDASSVDVPVAVPQRGQEWSDLFVGKLEYPFGNELLATPGALTG